MLKPDVVVIENVPEVVHGKGRVVDRTGADLERQGYTVDCQTLKLSAFGVPQTRKRHVLVATRLRKRRAAPEGDAPRFSLFARDAPARTS